MRGVTAITALALFLAVPAWAQHSGGHAGSFGGGHGGGFSGGHGGGFVGHGGFGGGRGSFSGGHVVGGHSFSGMRGPSGPIISRGFTHLPSSRATLSRRPFLHEGFRDSRFRNRAFHDHRFREDESGEDEFGEDEFRNNCVGFACRNWGWGSGWGWGWSDPWVWSSWEDEDRRFDEDYYRQYAMADEWNERNLEEQRMMRQEEADEDQDVYAPRSSNRRSSPESSSQAAEPVAATVLVFRDHPQQEIQNYAIVGQILWAFSSGRTQKIPMADLDLAATQKANDDRGVTFRVPAANEAQ